MELWHPEQAETYMLRQVSDFLNKLQFLSAGVLSWRPRYLKYRPSRVGAEIGYGIKRFEAPYSFSDNKKSIGLLKTISDGKADLNLRCSRILQFWGLSRQCEYDYELKFTYLWQIIELINTKAASKGKLCSTIPVYWLYNRFKTSSSDLNIEFEKIKTDFDSLYVMRSRGIVHRSMASWEPYSLRLYVQKLETYVNIFISNLFNLLLTDSTLISKDIESIMHKMMMDLVNRKLNQSYVDRFFKDMK